jgi:MoxR-like ATPase
MTKTAEFAGRIIDNVESVIVGKRAEIEQAVIALLCRGHLLLEDVPGTGKTMLARALAASLELDFKRLQCTPDLLPNDVTGVNVFNQQTSGFEFRPGPVFVGVLLADEINRATPRTQSALLEAMQERQVTVDGQSRPLPEPFLVIATQNPVEFEGTFPLPEAQLDRFLVRLSIGYPDVEDEMEIVERLRRSHPIEAIGQVAEPAELKDHAGALADIHLEPHLTRYVVTVVQATRSHPDVSLGASPRGAIGLAATARALAALRDRDFVLPDDVKAMAVPTLAHRIVVRPESELRGVTARSVVESVLASTEVALDDGS